MASVGGDVAGDDWDDFGVGTLGSLPRIGCGSSGKLVSRTTNARSIRAVLASSKLGEARADQQGWDGAGLVLVRWEGRLGLRSQGILTLGCRVRTGPPSAILTMLVAAAMKGNW
jgi:hypothetical protein